MSHPEVSTSSQGNERPPLPDSLVSIVLPVFNESKVLDRLLAQVQTAVAGCGTTAEIIFVNDGSTDASPEILDSACADGATKFASSTFRETLAIRPPCKPDWRMRAATRSC